MLQSGVSVVRIAPRCPSPWGRPLAALLRPGCSSPVRQWCAVPRLSEFMGPPSCRLARLRINQYGAFVVRSPPVAPVQGAALLLPCSPLDVPVRGVGGPRSPGCSSPGGCLFAALLCPGRSSPVRRWSAVPQLLQSRGPPSCRLALPWKLQSGASCLPSPYVPLLRVVFLPLLIYQLPQTSRLSPVDPGFGTVLAPPSCSAPDVQVPGCSPSSPGCSCLGGHLLAALRSPGCSIPGCQWSA